MPTSPKGPSSVGKYDEHDMTLEEEIAKLTGSSNEEILQIFLKTIYLLERFESSARDKLGSFSQTKEAALSGADSEFADLMREFLILEAKSDGGENFGKYAEEDFDFDSLSEQETEAMDLEADKEEAAYAAMKDKLVDKLIELGFFVKPTADEIRRDAEKMRVMVRGALGPENTLGLVDDQEREALANLIEH